MTRVHFVNITAGKTGNILNIYCCKWGTSMFVTALLKIKMAIL